MPATSSPSTSTSPAAPAPLRTGFAIDVPATLLARARAGDRAAFEARVLLRRAAFEPLLLPTTRHIAPCYAYRDQRPGETEAAYGERVANELEEEILRDHVGHCVEHAIASGNKADQRQKIEELMAVIGRAEPHDDPRRGRAVVTRRDGDAGERVGAPRGVLRGGDGGRDRERGEQ